MSPKIFTLDTLRFINIINSLVLLLCTEKCRSFLRSFTLSPPRYAAYAQYCAQYAPQAVA